MNKDHSGRPDTVTRRQPHNDQAHDDRAHDDQVHDDQVHGNRALDVADFEIDDVLSTPGDRLMAEVADDFGDRGALAAEFDAIALALLSGTRRDAADRATGVAAASAGGAVAAARRLTPTFPSPESALRRAMTAAAQRVAAPLRSRAGLAALATLMLFAVLVPEVYPLLLPVPDRRPAPSVEAVPAEPASPPPPPAARGAAPPADSPAPAAAEQDAAPAPSVSPSPETASATPEPPGAAKPVTPGRQRRADAPAPSGGFVVQLSLAGSEARARSSFRTLTSKYPLLKDHEPLVRRTGDERRGAAYALEVGPFASAQEADRLCARLKAAGGDCSVHGK